MKTKSCEPFVLNFSYITLSWKQVHSFYTALHTLAPGFFFQFILKESLWPGVAWNCCSGNVLIVIALEESAIFSILVTTSTSLEQQDNPGIAAFPIFDLGMGKWAVKFCSYLETSGMFHLQSNQDKSLLLKFCMHDYFADTSQEVVTKICDIPMIWDIPHLGQLWMV